MMIIFIKFCRGDEDCNFSCNDVDLAYQQGGRYPELIDELEESITQRNKERFQKSMRHFEMLSRNNGSYESSFMDDEDDYMCKPQRPKSRDRQSLTQRPLRVSSEDRYKNLQTKNEYLAKRPAFQPTPFTRSAGYVEKVVKYMDPNVSADQNKLAKLRSKVCSTRWELDPRSGEWYKVCDRSFDFENSFPPLPPPPPPKDVCSYTSARRGFDYRQNSQKFSGKTCTCSVCNCRDKRL